ncbi:MAG TPA: LPXTG cell wall anchor domain-containing protein [Pseudonocardiaceae bacterium]
MALSPTTRRWTSAARIALGSGVVAATALVGLAVPAGAHTPKVYAHCEDGTTTLVVELKSYNGQQDNSVKVTANEQTVLDENDFGTDLTDSWEFDGTVDQHFVVRVMAWDDPKSNKGWSFTKELTVEACATAPTTTTTTTTTETTATTTVTEPTTTTEETTTTTSEETTAPPATTTEQVAPTTVPADDDDLADTGASIAIPLVLGALLLLGGGALVLVARRRRTAAE